MFFPASLWQVGKNIFFVNQFYGFQLLWISILQRNFQKFYDTWNILPGGS